jgi:hypothetical protein
MTFFSKAFLLAGVGMIVRASHQTIQQQQQQGKARPRPFSSPLFLIFPTHLFAGTHGQASPSSSIAPWPLLLDLALAFVLCLTGALLGAASFRPTHLSHDRPKDNVDFAVFNHRGPLLRSRQL